MSILTKQIEQELDWRESELISLKLLVATTQKNSVRYEALLRSLLVMLYAHYEGFCKFAWEAYLDAIKRKKVKRKDCCEPLMIFSLKKDFRVIAGNFSAKDVWEYFSRKIPHMLNEEVKFDSSLETQSNLWPTLLKSNLEEIGLACTSIDTHETVLRALVSRRTSIAHGQKSVINSISDYEVYEKAVFDVMYDLALTIIESLDNMYYANRQTP